MKDVITRISLTDDVCLITLHNITSTKTIGEILTEISSKNISVDMITQSSIVKNGTCTLSFTISADYLTLALSTLNHLKGENIITEISNSNCKVCIFGQAMENIPGVAAKVISVIAQAGVETNLITTSEVDISILIDQANVDRTMSALKSSFGVS